MIDEAPDAPAFAQQASGLLVPGRGPTVSREEALDALEGHPPSRCPPLRRIVELPACPRASTRTIAGIRSRSPGRDTTGSSSPIARGARSRLDLRRQADRRGARGGSRAARHIPRRAERAGEAGRAGRAARRPGRLADAGGSRARGAHARVCAPGPCSPARPVWARASLLTVPVGLSTALALSALEVTEPATVVAVLAVVTAAGALALAPFTREPVRVRGCPAGDLPGLPRRARDLDGDELAGRDRAASRERRALLRLQQPARDARARAGPARRLPARPAPPAGRRRARPRHRRRELRRCGRRGRARASRRVPLPLAAAPRSAADAAQPRPDRRGRRRARARSSSASTPPSEGRAT